MSEAGQAPSGGYQKLPPGWDCKYDQATGNCYYINYLTKAMQLEDPRAGRGNYKQLQNERCSTESIALQHINREQSSHHNSPFHVVHPSNNLTAVRAFQERERQQQPALHNLSTSPLLSASSRGQLEMSSPLPCQRARLPSNMSRRSTIQETSFTQQIDTHAVVTKIQNMFPTADENHIRLLLKRYYNREAVVISALQVEKHPVTMPGPFVTPPAQRHLFHSNSAFYMTPPARRPDMAASRVTVTSRTASPLPGGRFGSLMSMQSVPTGASTAAVPGTHHPLGAVPHMLHGSPQWRSSPKPHSSPKMKLRYMKNIFPKADEMLLLDVLANADNHVQFASEKLIALGYTKRDMQQPHRPNNRPPLGQAQDLEQAAGNELGVQHIPLRPKEYSAAEKADMEALLKERYPQIAERIILMALESVNYAEDRATQILQIVQDEDEQRSKKHTMIKTMSRESCKQLPATEVDGAAPISSKPHKIHRHLPSINVTTPTTATTQIILSNTPTRELASPAQQEEQVQQQQRQKLSKSPSPISSASSHSYVSPTQSPTRQFYERLTTKSILAGATNNNKNNNNYSVSGYLHGSGSSTSTSSYSSYATSMTSASASSITKGIDSRTRAKNGSLKQRQHSSHLEQLQNSESAEFQSLIERMATLGPNSQLIKGADENLLLADYVTWNGPNTALSQKQPAQGPDASLLSGERGYKPSGRNEKLCKGAKKELAKGSIYAQGKGTNIKCN